MSYAITMDAEKIKCRIPTSELPNLIKEFKDVEIRGREIAFTLQWEEDGEPIRGTIEGDEIVLDPEQHGTYKNSSDGGLELLLERYKGSGIVTETGEDDEQSVYKFTDGIQKKGKITFE